MENMFSAKRNSGASVLIILLVTMCSAEQVTHDLVITSGDVRWTFATNGSLAIKTVEFIDVANKKGIIQHSPARPLFDLNVGQTLPLNAEMNEKGGYDWQPGTGQIEANSIEVIKIEELKRKSFTTTQVQMRVLVNNVNIMLMVEITPDGSGGVEFEAIITNNFTDRYIKTTLRGPILENIGIGNDSWYFFPRGRGILNNSPCKLASYYGQYVWMQCMGVFLKDEDIVLSIVPLEHEAQPKLYITQKAGSVQELVIDNSFDAPLHDDLFNSSGITQAIVWPDWVTEPNGKSVYGPVSIRIRKSNDWRDIYTHYREYLNTWWQPKTRPWIRYAYSGVTEHSYCADTIQEHIDWALPIHDYVESFLVKPFRLTHYLDYSLVGPKNTEGIYEIVQGRHAKNIRTTIYVHGKAIEPTDEFAKAHARGYTLSAPIAGEKGGGPPGTGADGLHWMNMHTQGWQNWLSEVCGDILTKTGVDGIRLDCIGYTMAHGGNGENPNIKTPPTQHDSMLKSSVDTVAQIRKAMNAVNPQATLGTENLGTDLMMNITDYSLSYNVWEGMWTPAKVYPSPVCYIRFVFPDFKFLEIAGEVDSKGNLQSFHDGIAKAGRFNQKEDIYKEALNQVLFNGIGHAGWNRAPNYMELFQTLQRVLLENTHCFEGEHLIPEIPTLKNNVYANYFALSSQKDAPRVITLMNWTRQPVAGEMIEISKSSEEKVIELVKLQNVTLHENKVNLQIEPMRTAVLRIVPGRIKAERSYGSLFVTLPSALAANQKLIAYRVMPDGRIGSAKVKMISSRTASIPDMEDKDRVAVQLMRLFFADAVRDVYVLEDATIIE